LRFIIALVVGRFFFIRLEDCEACSKLALILQEIACIDFKIVLILK